MPLNELQQKKRQEFISRLRAVADFYDQHPDLRAPDNPINFQIYCQDKDEFIEARRAGKFRDKRFIEDFMYFRHDFSEGKAEAFLDLNISRTKVCRRVVTGTRVEPSHYVPERTVETVEWVCDEPLLADQEGGSDEV